MKDHLLQNKNNISELKEAGKDDLEEKAKNLAYNYVEKSPNIFKRVKKR